MVDSTTARTYQFRVQLTSNGHSRLDERLRAHARLYNAALQERRDAWRMARVSLSFASQCRELTPGASGRPRMGRRAPPSGRWHPEAR